MGMQLRCVFFLVTQTHLFLVTCSWWCTFFSWCSLLLDDALLACDVLLLVTHNKPTSSWWRPCFKPHDYHFLVTNIEENQCLFLLLDDALLACDVLLLVTHTTNPPLPGDDLASNHMTITSWWWTSKKTNVYFCFLMTNV